MHTKQNIKQCRKSNAKMLFIPGKRIYQVPVEILEILNILFTFTKNGFSLHHFEEIVLQINYRQKASAEISANMIYLDNELSYQHNHCIQSSIQTQTVIKEAEELKRSFKPQCLRSHSPTLHIFSYWLFPCCLLEYRVSGERK